MMKYLNGTTKLQLLLRAGNLHCIKWYVDASFAVHPDFKSHTGAAMHFEDGAGAVQSISRKQKLNTKKQHGIRTRLSRQYISYDIMDTVVHGSTRLQNMQEHLISR
jgi:hypothetical protein